MVSITSDSRFSTATSEPAPVLSKEQRKQQECTAARLAFLVTIEKVTVTGSKYYDEREHLLFDVTIKDHDKHAVALGPEKAIEKEALKIQPTVNYSNMKALSTLAGVHKAICDWSSKPHHGDSNTSPCAYCSQFNSPEALQLWTSTGRQENSTSNNDSAALVLAQLDKYLNTYLEWTRNVPEGINRSECAGYAHIPTMIAALLQNESYNSVALDLAVSQCVVM